MYIYIEREIHIMLSCTYTYTHTSMYYMYPAYLPVAYIMQHSYGMLQMLQRYHMTLSIPM